MIYREINGISEMRLLFKDILAFNPALNRRLAPIADQKPLIPVSGAVEQFDFIAPDHVATRFRLLIRTVV